VTTTVESHTSDLGSRGVRVTGFDPRGPRGHVATGGRGQIFLKTIRDGRGTGMLTSPAGGAGKVVNGNIRSSGGRG
jgi:hypothetical protein